MRNRPMLISGIFFLALLIGTLCSFAGNISPEMEARNRPNPPFRLMGNIYYVGASDLTSYLITTPKGHILLDAGLTETAPLIQNNLAQLGFRLEDVKLILVTHGHFDHAGGVAALKAASHAQLVSCEAERSLLESGGKGDFHYGDQLSYAPVKVDRVLKDREVVELGGVKIKAWLTPGHTKGCITWTMQVKEEGKLLNVVFVGSTTIPGYRLVHNTSYPEIAEDYARMFVLLKQLPCDVFLGAHGVFFSLQEKMKLLQAGSKPNPFIDPLGYAKFIEAAHKTYLEQIQRESNQSRQ